MALSRYGEKHLSFQKVTFRIFAFCASFARVRFCRLIGYTLDVVLRHFNIGMAHSLTDRPDVHALAYGLHPETMTGNLPHTGHRW